jgi:hypothetical protein
MIINDQGKRPAYFFPVVAGVLCRHSKWALLMEPENRRRKKKKNVQSSPRNLPSFIGFFEWIKEKPAWSHAGFFLY